MHIPDAYLSPATEVVFYGAMAPVWWLSTKRTRKTLSSRQAPMLSIGAAFCFAIQMLNVPALGGTTAHPLGIALTAILLGPWAAILAATLCLATQALFFGDGGVLSLGANAFSMGFVAAFGAHFVYKLLANRLSPGFAAGAAAYVGTVLASVSAGTILGMQPLLAHDAVGHALYFPFGLSVALPAMVGSHLFIAGPVEAFVTAGAFLYLCRNVPEYAPGACSRDLESRGRRLSAKRLKSTGVDLGNNSRVAQGDGYTTCGRSGSLLLGLVFLLLLTPLGLIASGSAWGEWELGEIRHMVGYAPRGIAQAHELIRPLLPDYGFAGVSGTMWSVVGCLSSAFLGALIVALVAKVVVATRQTAEPAGVRIPVIAGGFRPEYRRGKGMLHTAVKARKAGPTFGARDAIESGVKHIEVEFTETANALPDWLLCSNPPVEVAPRRSGRWLEKTIAGSREAVADTLAAERWARQRGLLQSLPASLSMALLLAALVVASVTRSPIVLCVELSVSLVLAVASRLPVWLLFRRAIVASLLFGVVPAGFTLLWHAAPPMLLPLRVGVSVFMTVLWASTTRWSSLIDRLTQLGVPSAFAEWLRLTYRYVFVLLDTQCEMQCARRSRQSGAATKDQMRSHAGVGAGVLFAKSLAMSEEVHQAMRSRTLGDIHVI